MLCKVKNKMKKYKILTDAFKGFKSGDILIKSPLDENKYLLFKNANYINERSLQSGTVDGLIILGYIKEITE